MRIINKYGIIFYVSKDIAGRNMCFNFPWFIMYFRRWLAKCATLFTTISIVSVVCLIISLSVMNCKTYLVNIAVIPYLGCLLLFLSHVLAIGQQMAISTCRVPDFYATLHEICGWWIKSAKRSSHPNSEIRLSVPAGELKGRRWKCEPRLKSRSLQTFQFPELNVAHTEGPVRCLWLW